MCLTLPSRLVQPADCCVPRTSDTVSPYSERQARNARRQRYGPHNALLARIASAAHLMSQDFNRDAENLAVFVSGLINLRQHGNLVDPG